MSSSLEVKFDERRRALAEERTGEIVMLVANKGWVALSAHYEEQPPMIIVQEVQDEEGFEVTELTYEQPSLI